MTGGGRHAGARELVRVRYARGPSGAFVSTAAERDWVAVEEPLELRISSEPWLVTMRTPGHDRELAAGLLASEGIVRDRSELGSLVHCGVPGEASYGNVLDVTLAPGAEAVWRRLDARALPVGSACGVCGRASIEELLSRSAPLLPVAPPPAEAIVALSEQLSQNQQTFARTGGVHAAALASAQGELLATFEDIGRHNAVDKVLGHRLLSGATAEGTYLVVSGRSSFEIVQKAIVARCAGVVGVSAPSSLAVATAERFGLLLVAFARDGGFNLYSGAVTDVRIGG